MFLPLLFLFFLAESNVIVSVDSVCPTGWTFSNDTSYCYFISDKYMTWDESVNYCSKLGGNLAYFTSSVEKTALIDLTKNLFAQPWLGVRRNSTTGTFYNLAGYSISSSYWSDGEPGVNGDCVTLKGVDSSGLAVTQCYSIQPALCRQMPALCPTETIYGGSYTRSGNITSPGYPVQYYNNLRCVYTITSPPNTYITINFEPYLVQDWLDSVFIYDGNSTSETLIGAIYLSYQKKSFESSSNIITFDFFTDATVTNRGWLASWTAKANTPPIYASGSNGTLQSPNYPNDYDSYTEQLYYITVADGFQVNITIDVFNTESRFDPLLIYNSSVISENTLYTSLSGDSIAPWNWISPSNTVALKFTSDGSIQKSGWHLFWQIA